MFEGFWNFKIQGIKALVGTVGAHISEMFRTQVRIVNGRREVRIPDVGFDGISGNGGHWQDDGPAH